jgi:hypothetical protein
MCANRTAPSKKLISALRAPCKRDTDAFQQPLRPRSVVYRRDKITAPVAVPLMRTPAFASTWFLGAYDVQQYRGPSPAYVRCLGDG